MLSLGKIAELGGIISAEPVKKHIEFKIYNQETGKQDKFDGDIWVKRIAVAEYERLADLQSPKNNKGGDRHYMGALIAAAVRLGESGEEVIPLEDALQFHPNMATAMIEAVNEVNGTGKKP